MEDCGFNSPISRLARPRNWAYPPVPAAEPRLAAAHPAPALWPIRRLSHLASTDKTPDTKGGWGWERKSHFYVSNDRKTPLIFFVNHDSEQMCCDGQALEKTAREGATTAPRTEKEQEVHTYFSLYISPNTNCYTRHTSRLHSSKNYIQATWKTTHGFRRCTVKRHSKCSARKL